MSDNNSQLIELLKYPILVFSIVLALIIVRHALDLEFGVVTEVSTEGLKFSEKSNDATLKALMELETKLNEMAVRLDRMEDPMDSSPESMAEVWDQTFVVSQTVSDATANIAQLNKQVKAEGNTVLSGWIWIGNYSDNWSKASIASLATGQPIDLDPTKMQPGTEYRTLGNMIVRDGLPPNNKDYYKSKASLGVVPRGSVITLLDTVEPVDREFAVQYWAKIEFLKK